jgi:ADP-ribosylglycohydrolase
MNQEKITMMQDQRRGALYGQAIGDALGAFYEFSGNLGPDERARYRDSGTAFKAGEWTDDTEQALVLLRAFIEESDDMAKAAPIIGEGFQKWLHDDGRGCGNHTGRVLTDIVYALDPLAVSEKVWEQGGRKAAPNGGVMRTVGVPLVRPWDNEWVIKAATLGCKATHFDPRCVASSVAVSVACAALIRGDGIPVALQQGIDAGKTIEPGIEKYLTMPLNKLKLGGPSIGFTYKCAGAGFWALWEFQRRDDEQYDDLWCDRFEDILNTLIRERGDTDTNGAVAGALMGTHVGFENLMILDLVSGLQHTEKLDELLNSLPKGGP